MMQQIAWLAQYGGLVGQLQLQSYVDSLSADEAAWNLRPPLQLRSLQLQVHTPLPLLKQLDPSRLTNLEISRLTLGSCRDEESPLLPRALSRLTGVQQLAVTGWWGCTHDSMAAALACMPQLALEPQLPAAALSHLPSQLVKLQLSNPQCEAAQLLACVQALKELQSLTLVYSSRSNQDILRRHAASYAAIPQLKQLVLDLDAASGNKLTADLAAGIAGATSLTRLYGYFAAGCAPEVDLVATLSPLKQLHSLELTMKRGDVPVQSFKRLFADNLAQLQSLVLDMWELPQLAVAQVCLQATRLTQMTLMSEALTDANLLLIADSMVGLKHAALSWGITADGLLSVLALPNLPRLEQLAYACGYDAKQRAAAATGLAQVRPTLSVVVVEDRIFIPHGFVGAYSYMP
jgi:hypothetical protein